MWRYGRLKPTKMLTIAGSDVLAGGGIQADLATFNEYGYFGLSASTSIVTVTPDDFTIHPVPIAILAAQLDAIFAIDDIAGVKVGLLPTVAHVELVAKYLKEYASHLPVIIDPVMAFKETSTTNVNELVKAIQTELLPLATITTPNLVEAELLSGRTIKTAADMTEAARIMQQMGAQSVVVKGGKRLAGQEAVDVLVAADGLKTFKTEKVANAYNNGAGCTFSSAIASQLAAGATTAHAVSDAKAFVYEGIKHGVPLNEALPVGNVWQAARRLSEEQ
ncbi:bifunctional hydroxymethylpyrimidine kinase/phosphomethylpyrimidine kinase [Weissella cibaria]|uniref:bifunctional hydroxymethylpyrimidine kinase/phosphomethylpyrimidine kinase n=2 Tax=Weissella cibaria TaxID=137591 RepID=UPI000705CF51|nr:bifunctional hydroxymethylpyrimidine kinase/phosphomethylpyrimidine kinase [Weissella cibaria]ALI33504.1 phosphomethylpyrimidine kinase [Weissella cibaria]MBD1502397.1 bifunctional hydroxymethylpyrimidine kinase/phosphomethylpyrimidine kinase [Weissella cibaria]WCE25945.1 bifunctional hydroxymethylpyrimidine kinase/phosphomethylpyrimidine kinase [Weissella cibaria]WCE28133.1 bifunctional hydroxymethylpyrimidine kinase/phosphomethylpyrimidine kinase [Weissella cibaria]